MNSDTKNRPGNGVAESGPSRISLAMSTYPIARFDETAWPMVSDPRTRYGPGVHVPVYMPFHKGAYVNPKYKEPMLEVGYCQEITDSPHDPMPPAPWQFEDLPLFDSLEMDFSDDGTTSPPSGSWW